MWGALNPTLGTSDHQKKVLLYVAAGASIPLLAAGVWYLCQETYYYYTPVEYQYRPGMISGWISRQLATYSSSRRKRRPIRVYMDGCFDLMHYGHCNALRQAKACGDVLVVGLIPDSEILANKGPPVMNEEERKVQVESVKWVDEVMTGVPYDLTPEFLEELFTKYKIDYVIHGDDPCLLPDGTDAYAHAKRLGKFRMIKRTEGVSTTDIVGRMLMCSRHNRRIIEGVRKLTRDFSGHLNGESMGGSQRVLVSNFMPTSRRIVQFATGKTPEPGARVVYIDGAFDVFHTGHIQVLQAVKTQGDFLIVGLHADEDVTESRGPHLPIMNLHERALAVLACRHVDEVIIGAPTVISEDMMKTFNISLVVRGTVSETSGIRPTNPQRYELPQQLNMFQEIRSPSSMTAATIIQRIVANQKAFEAKHKRKAEAEAKYYANKEVMQEM